ncbi:MAG: hypothetical protein ACLFRL_06135 [Desulfohalobiaceae bacterium]
MQSAWGKFLALLCAGLLFMSLWGCEPDDDQPKPSDDPAQEEQQENMGQGDDDDSM